MENYLSDGSFELDILDYLDSYYDNGLLLKDFIQYLHQKYGEAEFNKIVKSVINELNNNSNKSYDKDNYEVIKAFPINNIRDLITVSFLIYACFYNKPLDRWVEIDRYRECNSIGEYAVEFVPKDSISNPLYQYNNIKNLEYRLCVSDGVFMSLFMRFYFPDRNTQSFYAVSIGQSFYLRIKDDRNISRFGFVINGPVNYDI